MNSDSRSNQSKARLRHVLALLSLMLVLFGLVALIYAFWPLPVEQVQQTLPPALFTPP